VTLHARGWAVRQLSREFGISRGRVSRILTRNKHSRETGSSPAKVTVIRASRLDAYKDYIAELLDTYREPPITGQRVLEKIRERGYDGGRTILGDYLAAVRGKQVGEPVFCVETSAGQRGSHDWSEYYIYFTGSDKKEKVSFSASF
jgi:transposase